MIDERLTSALFLFRTAFSAVRARIPIVLADPRSYPREAMVLAMIAVLGIVFVLILVFLIQEQVVTVRKRSALGIKRDFPGMARRLVWAVAITVVVGLGLASLPLIPAVGTACGGCHVTSVPVSAWANGQHSQVSCYACHAAPGVLGALSASTLGLGNLASAVRKDAVVGAPGNLSSDGCINCHESIARGVTGTGVRMRHSDVIEARMPCVQCHRAVGHEGGRSPASKASPSQLMAVCLTCHDDERAPSDCEVCHASHPLDTATQPENPGSTSIQMTCDGCHKATTRQSCIACHGLELPHPPGFRRQHAALSSDNPALCAKCHELATAEKACSCHNEVNEHGTYSEWFPRHGPMAKQTGPMGCNCHARAFCLMCHTSSPFGP